MMRFGQAKGDAARAFEAAQDEFLFLLLGAPLQDGRADERVAEEVAA